MKTFKGSQNRKIIDIKNWLFEGVILKEKKFREHLKDENWEEYKNTFVALHCSTDTIIPVWAYMLLTKYLNQKTNMILINIVGVDCSIFRIIPQKCTKR